MARVTMLSIARPAALLLLPASRLTAATLLDTSATRPSMPDTALLASLTVCEGRSKDTLLRLFSCWLQAGKSWLTRVPSQLIHQSTASAAPHLALQVLDC